MQLAKSPKKKQLQQQQSRDPLPVVGKEVEVEGKILLNYASVVSVIETWDTLIGTVVCVTDDDRGFILQDKKIQSLFNKMEKKCLLL